MGQRHQAFIIARIKPYGSSAAKYRCIAAYDNGWCYGSLPLRAAHRVLCSVRQPQNAEVIREELRSIDGKYGRYDAGPEMPAAACPFIVALLADNWDIGLAPGNILLTGSSLKGSMLEVDMHLWDSDIDNDDGYTVIDVTNPEDPAYCFIGSARRDPEDARRYIRRYYWFPGDAIPDVTSADGSYVVEALPTEPEAPDERDLALRRYENGYLPLINHFQDVRLLDASAIREAWFPEEEKEDGNVGNDGEGESDEDGGPGDELKSEGGEGDKSEEGAEQYQTHSAIVTSVPSLVDISLRKSLVRAIDSGETGALEDMPWLSERMGIVEEILDALSPFPDAALPFLQRLAKAKKYRGTSLDLAGYPLTVSQIISIATTLPEIHSLNLSMNSTLDVADVREVLARLPSLARLVLMNCPSLEADELVQLVGDHPELFRHMQSIVHPAFINISNSSVWAGMPVRMVVVAFRSLSRYAGISFPLVTPGVLIQGLLDLLTFKEDLTAGASLYMHGKRALEVAFASLPRASGTPWTERTLARPFLFPKAPSHRHTSDCWMLYVSTASFPPDLKDDMGYAFLQLQQTVLSDGEERAVTWRDFLLHDLRSFMRTTEQQGYPSVPEDLAGALEGAIEKNKLPVYTREQILESTGGR
ncbi:hypothetical protein PsYK624_000460 [Phanerochaete sordida]|uniref:Uncharacterized protein n=1 Tax=Phanerochaete sordida TaxID=48140 RepID=A0A9P3FVQ8_9APHY|nr:hypothetical protein PsYK624_000460 [Phanerochaete sordida]